MAIPLALMRSVSFVDRVELDFSGNHFSHALALGDVDGDGLNELVLGNVEGMLAVFKGNGGKKPWRMARGLGTITCVGIGGVIDRRYIDLVCITATGKCYIFSIYGSISKGKTSSTSSTSSKESPNRTIQPAYSQVLLPNIKVLLIAGIAADGREELFVGHTDRVVRVYRWDSITHSLQSKHMISLDNQIGSLSVSLTDTNIDQVLVSQAGGTYIPLYYIEGDEGEGTWKDGTLVQGQMVGRTQRTIQSSSSTEVVGDLRSREDLVESGRHSNIVALCTLDGSIKLMKDEHKVWEHQVDHNLFSIAKLDITNDGQDEVVVCAWDGTTYILDHFRNVVRYKFEDNVCAFCAGSFGFVSEHNKHCLIYTTFSGKIYIYHDITLPTIPPSNLISTMMSQKLPPELRQHLQTLTDAEKRKLFRRCLYGE